MSLIDRYEVERRVIGGVERDVLVVWTVRLFGGERVPDAISEAQALSQRLGYEHMHIEIPPAKEPPVAQGS